MNKPNPRNQLPCSNCKGAEQAGSLSEWRHSLIAAIEFRADPAIQRAIEARELTSDPVFIRALACVDNCITLNPIPEESVA